MGISWSDEDRLNDMLRDGENYMRAHGEEIPTNETQRVPEFFGTDKEAVRYFIQVHYKLNNATKKRLYNQKFVIGTGNPFSYAERKRKNLIDPDNPFGVLRGEGEDMVIQWILNNKDKGLELATGFRRGGKTGMIGCHLGYPHLMSNGKMMKCSNGGYTHDIRTQINRKNGGTLLEEAEDDSWSNWASNIWSSFTSDTHLPKRFRKFIKAHGREPITSLQMVRAPVDKLGTLAVQAITAGKWDDLKKKAGIDSVFHTGMVVNGKYVLEKLEKLEGRVDPNYINQKDAEVYPLDLQGMNLTIAELLENARKKMGTNFYKYDFLLNNCQNYVMTLAEASGLLTPEARKWIKQDIESLIKEFPSLSKYLGVKLTDIARDTSNIFEEFTAKRGGKIRPITMSGVQSGRSGRMFNR
jgi:hypothetical protein